MTLVRFDFKTRAALVALGLLLAATPARANERRFAYSYEPNRAPAGSWEIEQWVTWKTAKRDSPGFHRFDLRTEVEVGVTDWLTLGLYLSDWRVERDADGTTRTDWRNAAIEAIVGVSDPVEDPIGFALYFEVKGGDELFELEHKLIFGKTLGPVTVAYNATIEAEWEGERFDERKGEFQQTLGVSYQISPRLLVGLELLHEIELPEWDRAERSVVYAGPNISVRSGSFFATLAPMIQVTSVREEPRFQARLIVGFHF